MDTGKAHSLRCYIPLVFPNNKDKLYIYIYNIDQHGSAQKYVPPTPLKNSEVWFQDIVEVIRKSM